MPDELPRLTPQECVLVYDGECRLCVAAKTQLERWREKDGHRIVYLPYQSRDARRWLGDLPRLTRPEVAVLIAEDGNVYRGFDAFVELCPHFRKGRFLSKLLTVPPMRSLARCAYRLLARHRYRWFGAVKPTDSA